MPIDRRAFLAGGCAAVGSLVSLTAIAAVAPASGAAQAAAAAPMATVAVGPADLDLRILGWDRDEPVASTSQDGPSWIAIDLQFRGHWH